LNRKTTNQILAKARYLLITHTPLVIKI